MAFDSTSAPESSIPSNVPVVDPTSLRPSPAIRWPLSRSSIFLPIIPQFLYKGHVDLGKRQRAIVAETTTGKTYFLEVGQEVAGFKVLDISRTEVVLSDVKTAQQIVIMRKAQDEKPKAGGAAEPEQ